MTEEIYAQNLKEIINNKVQLEKELHIKITNKGRNLFLNGAPEREYAALKVIEAINLGFSSKKALLLKDENMVLYIINIRDLTRRKDLHLIKARIIGTRGRTKSNLQNLSECFISVINNQVGIIGEVDYIEEAIIAIKSLIQGSKQGKVYARLERKRRERKIRPPEIAVKRNKP